MSWIDAVILAWVVLAALRGRSIGALTQLLGLIGFIAGFVAGALVAKPIAQRLGVGVERDVVTVCVVLGVALIGGVIGHMLGRWANTALRRIHLGAVDSIAGAVVGAVGALLSAWLVAGLFAESSVTWLTHPIQGSAVLTALNAVMPPVPSVVGRAEAYLSTDVFPLVSVDLIQPQTSWVREGTPHQTQINAGNTSSSVLKVLAYGGCGAGLGREGTSFVVAKGLVITDAHVVAGETVIDVVAPTGTIPAELVVFDPSLDVAVLRVPGLTLTPISLNPAVLKRGTTAAVVGYPDNGPLTTSPAGIQASFVIQGRDIYGGGDVTRSVYAITANVQKGNSGSPLLVRGAAVGMVFSRSLLQADTGYALRARILVKDIRRAERGRDAVPPGACTPG